LNHAEAIYDRVHALPFVGEFWWRIDKNPNIKIELGVLLFVFYFIHGFEASFLYIK